eukprot:GILJ01037033.1.p1 GENE.GILJ01037033.1~~GILJ01037033.1.p1  ORF type:complete len:190 (-),score=30.47 GILJ01037033.1:60-629(-)
MGGRPSQYENERTAHVFHPANVGTPNKKLVPLAQLRKVSVAMKDEGVQTAPIQLSVSQNRDLEQEFEDEDGEQYFRSQQASRTSSNHSRMHYVPSQPCLDFEEPEVNSFSRTSSRLSSQSTKQTPRLTARQQAELDRELHEAEEFRLAMANATEHERKIMELASAEPPVEFKARKGPFRKKDVLTIHEM